MLTDVGKDLPLDTANVGEPSMSEVSRVLSAIEGGDPHAADQLLPLVYQELRQLAAQKLAQEKVGQTLEATALVHEAYLRLVDVDRAQYWNSRRHFFAAAAEAMRRILVERARSRGSRKRGGGRQRLDLENVTVASPERPDELLALDEALTRLALDRICVDDAALRQRLEGLLSKHDRAASFLGLPGGTAAALAPHGGPEGHQTRHGLQASHCPF
jgi:RNA polymerase sigma factor (TIGR02999 family)